MGIKKAYRFPLFHSYVQGLRPTKDLTFTVKCKERVRLNIGASHSSGSQFVWSDYF